MFRPTRPHSPEGSISSEDILEEKGKDEKSSLSLPGKLKAITYVASYSFFYLLLANI